MKTTSQELENKVECVFPMVTRSILPPRGIRAKMAFILGVTRKLLGNHTADLKQILGFQSWARGFRND